MRITKQQILAADDTVKQMVPVPEWLPGAEIEVRSLNLEQADKWRRNLMVKTQVRQRNGVMTTELVFDTENAQKNEVLLIVAGAIDENGSPLFTTDDVTALMSKSLLPCKRLVAAIMDISGLSDEAKAATVSDAVKN